MARLWVITPSRCLVVFAPFLFTVKDQLKSQPASSINTRLTFKASSKFPLIRAAFLDPTVAMTPVVGLPAESEELTRADVMAGSSVA